MTYDVTLLSNSTNPVQVVSGLQQISGGLYGSMTFLTIYVIILMVIPREYLPNVMLGLSFIMSIIAGIMLGLGWLQWWIVAINITILAGSIIWKIWGGNQ